MRTFDRFVYCVLKKDGDLLIWTHKLFVSYGMVTLFAIIATFSKRTTVYVDDLIKKVEPDVVLDFSSQLGKILTYTSIDCACFFDSSTFANAKNWSTIVQLLLVSRVSLLLSDVGLDKFASAISTFDQDSSALKMKMKMKMNMLHCQILSDDLARCYRTSEIDVGALRRWLLAESH